MTANPTTAPDGSRAIASQALSIIDSHNYPMINTEISNLEVLPPDTTAMHPAPVTEIAAINRYHHRATSAADDARAKAEEASHFALLAGTLLEDLQASTAHGEWGKLFVDRKSPNAAQIGECAAFDFSVDTARRYIEVAKRIRAEQSLSGIAQKKLSAIASAPEITDDGREFLNKLTKGQTLRQLYLGLDIITATAKAKPDKPAQPRIGKTEKQDRLEDAREMIQVWQDAWEKIVRDGYLDDLIPADLQRLKEFHLGMGDRIKARLK